MNSLAIAGARTQQVQVIERDQVEPVIDVEALIV
jgi:hypothetical protein